MVVWCKWCGKQIGNSVFTAQELKEDWKLTCPECGKYGFIAHDPHRKYIEHKDGFPHIDWENTFEKLRELADKADSLASDIEETEEYCNRHADWHDTAIVLFNQLTGIMQTAARWANDISEMEVA